MWLPVIIQRAQFFMSQSDIESGSRGFETIASTLEKCDFGIVCATHHAIGSPWVNFEAGALSKRLDVGRVVPLLLGIDLSELLEHPLRQFQARTADGDGLRALLRDMNRALPPPIDDAVLSKSVDASLSPLLKALDACKPDGKAGSPKAKSGSDALLERLVDRIQSLERSLIRLPSVVSNIIAGESRYRNSYPRPFNITGNMRRRAGMGEDDKAPSMYEGAEGDEFAQLLTFLDGGAPHGVFAEFGRHLASLSGFASKNVRRLLGELIAAPTREQKDAVMAELEGYLRQVAMNSESVTNQHAAQDLAVLVPSLRSAFG